MPPAGGALLFALDLGSNTGWAVYRYHENLAQQKWRRQMSGAWKLGSDGPTRVSRFAEELAQLERLYGRPALVAYEKVYRHLGTHACHVYGALEGQVELFVHQRGIGLWPVTVQAVKKRATGKGNAKKEPVLEAARAKIHPGISTFDEADACWVAEVASDEAYRDYPGDESSVGARKRRRGGGRAGAGGSRADAPRATRARTAKDGGAPATERRPVVRRRGRTKA